MGRKKDYYAIYEYQKSLVNGSGLVPLEVFDFSQSSNVYFDMVDISRRNASLLSVLEHFKRNGIEFWVRDNSFLDFPAYYVYSPQLSPVSDLLRPQVPFVYYQICTDTFFNINPKYHICDNLTQLEKEQLCIFLEMNIGKELMLHPYRMKGDGNSYNAFLLLMAYKLAIGMYNEVLNMVEIAHDYIYMDEQYYYALKTALGLAANGCPEHIIRSNIVSLCDIETVSDIIADLFIKTHSLTNYQNLNLYNLFIEDSVYSDWIKVQEKISNISLAKKIEQEKIMATILQSD